MFIWMLNLKTLLVGKTLSDADRDRKSSDSLSTETSILRTPLKKGYFEGIVENLRLMQKYYPGWIMRLYYNMDKSDPVLAKICELACSDQNLDLCDAENLPGTPMKDAVKVFAMNWRFFPTIDPQVISIRNEMTLHYWMHIRKCRE